MLALKAHVHGGRLLLDEPTDLPEGETVILVQLESPDELDAEERVRLDAALELGLAQARAGQVVDGHGVVAKLLARA